jgi:hypothetical protein
MLIAMETLVRKDPRLVWVVAAAIVAEFVAALVLLQRQNRVRGVAGSGRGVPLAAMGQPAE